MSAIGVFDSGYGGLTILRSIQDILPNYDYLYLGDNARAPYGNRSFDTIYEYTWQAVQWFFRQGCPLVILACNTSSAKALRSIQQRQLPLLDDKSVRVLGVIRPTSEIIATYSSTGHIGILATKGTVQSKSYLMEIEKFSPGTRVTQQACPMWVPLIENNEYETTGGQWFIQRDVESFTRSASDVDTLLLACTHYPIIKSQIQKWVPAGVKVLSQGEIIAASLQNYLERHPEMEQKLSKNAMTNFYTTDNTDDFNEKAALFFGKAVLSKYAHLYTDGF
jgi:glutamate racemase